MLSLLSKRILQTIAYTDQFLFPLKVEEIWLRLMMKTSLTAVRQEVGELLKAGLIHQQTGYYSLPGAKKLSQVRQERQELAEQYQQSIEEVTSVLNRIPWVKAVAVTGSLSLEVARPGDDLDLMIITEPNRLWLTRLVVTMIATIKGRRRYWWEDQAWLTEIKTTPGQFQPKWCLNLWLTTETMTVPATGRSVYTAYEVGQAHFVLSRGGVEQAFLRANSWVRSVLPQFWSFRLKQAVTRQRSEEKVTLGLSIFISLVDWLVFQAQVWYMKPRVTREKVSRNMAYFHPRPTNNLVQQGWEQSLKKVFQAVTTTVTPGLMPEPAPERTGVPTPPLQLDATFSSQLQKVQARKQTIVLVTGVFDLLHYAHRQFLLKAKSRGDVLVVGIESDIRVRQLKGEGRPIHSQLERQRQLENLGIADAVFILPEQFSKPADHQALIQAIRPQILAVSAHSPHQEAKQAVMDLVGGKVEVVMEHDPSVSTTLLLQQMK